MKIIRPFLCLLFCTTFLLSAGEITLQSGDLSIHFSERGALLDIRRNGEGMLDNSPEAPAWSLYYKGGEITAAQYEQLPSVYNGGGETTFRWEQKGLPVVVCSVRPNDQRDGFAFSFAVENESKFRLDDFRFPHEFRLKIRNPEDYLLVVANNKHDTYLTPLQKLRRFEVMYPGFMAMQFAGFRINGDALLFYTDDTQSFVKHHSFSSKKGVLTYTVNHYIALEPDRFWEPDFSLIFRYIPGGDYNDMAHKYGEWARRQSWAKVKMEDKIAQRPVLDRILT
ncbi:MAG: hypothetical protein J6S21_08180, partial [Victivallales bacterium]|nr:hypothetical protein [Victivallales bacterium]